MKAVKRERDFILSFFGFRETINFYSHSKQLVSVGLSVVKCTKAISWSFQVRESLIPMSSEMTRANNIAIAVRRSATS